MRASQVLAWATLALLAAPRLCPVRQAEAADAPKPEVGELASSRQGATWITLRWDSNVSLHDVMWAELRGVRQRPWRWQTITGVPTATYTVVDLKPGTGYQFRIRARGAGATATSALSATITARTRPEAPLAWWGLTFWPERHFPAPPGDVAYSGIEAYKGKLYILQTVGARLWLSRVAAAPLPPRRGLKNAYTLGKDHMQVEWTRDITPITNEPEAPCLAPHLRVFGDRLWVTWHAQLKEPTDPDFTTFRQRLMYYDLADSEKDAAGQPYQQRVSAPLQIEPSLPGRDTCFGSVTVFQDALWLQWTEVWREDEGNVRSLICLGQYDAARGRIADPIPWYDCPSLTPLTASAAQFADSMLVLYGDGGEDATSAHAQPLMCARFDGRGFYGTRLLRGLGKNALPRAVQVHDQLYVVHQTDVAYPGAGGIWQDLCLTRLDARGLVSEAMEFVTDTKYNAAPSIAAMGDDLYIAYTKHDQWPRESAGLPAQSFGTYLCRVSVVTEGE